MSKNSNYVLLFVVLIMFSAALGYLLAHLTAVKPAQKLNALHMQAWAYVTNLDAGAKILDSFVLPVEISTAPADSLVLRIQQKDKKEQYVVFLQEDTLHLEASQLIPRLE